jgi:hypothetical protein
MTQRTNIVRECRVHSLGFLTIAHWLPRLGEGYAEMRQPPRRFTYSLGREWHWWPRPGYEQFRPWRKLP